MLKPSWTLSCHSVNEICCYFAGGYCGKILCLSANEGSELVVRRNLRLSISYIAQDEWSLIIDTLLTLMFRMTQGLCRIIFCLKRQPLPHFGIFIFNLHLPYPTSNTKCGGFSIDSTSLPGVASLSYLVFILKVVNTIKKDINVSKLIFDD